MTKNNNKISKNAITKEQHKGQILFFIGLALTFAFMILTLFHKISIANIPLLSLLILSIYAYATLKNLKVSLRYLFILLVFFLAMLTSRFSIFLTSTTSIANVGEALVVATTICVLIDIEFYKHMKESILKVPRNHKTKQGLFTEIDMAFIPMMASTFALFFALVALMAPILSLSILLIDISIFLILSALIMPIDLFAEDLLTQAHYFKS